MLSPAGDRRSVTIILRILAGTSVYGDPNILVLSGFSTATKRSPMINQDHIISTRMKRCQQPYKGSKPEIWGTKSSSYSAYYTYWMTDPRLGIPKESNCGPIAFSFYVLATQYLQPVFSLSPSSTVHHSLTNLMPLSPILNELRHQATATPAARPLFAKVGLHMVRRDHLTRPTTARRN